MPKISRRGPRNVPFVITKNSVIDQFGMGYGKGEVKLDRATADFFRKKDAGYYPDELEEETPAPKQKISPAPPSGQGKAIQGIPDDFPEREKLVGAGFNSLDELRAEGAEEKIAAINGIGKAAMKKIGLALET